LEEPRQLVLVAHGKEDVEKAYAVLEEDVGDVSPSREVRVRREVDDEVAEGGARASTACCGAARSRVLSLWSGSTSMKWR